MKEVMVLGLPWNLMAQLRSTGPSLVEMSNSSLLTRPEIKLICYGGFSVTAVESRTSKGRSIKNLSELYLKAVES